MTLANSQQPGAPTPRFQELRSTLPGVLDRTLALVGGDVDGDGAFDLLVGNDDLSGTATSRLLRNDGAAAYQLASGALPTTLASISALALLDADRDGDLDAWVGTAGQVPAGLPAIRRATSANASDNEKVRMGVLLASKLSNLAACASHGQSGICPAEMHLVVPSP